MIFKLLFSTVLLLILHRVLKVIYLLGYHRTVYNHRPGQCRHIPTMQYGSEDLETLPNGMTFITSSLATYLDSSEFRSRLAKNGMQGAIYLFDFNRPTDGVTELSFDSPFDRKQFRPHGLSVIQNEKTKIITLFVVSHREGYEAVEKFEFVEDKKSLKHIRTYRDERMQMINDVAAKDENSFYVTNHAYCRTSIGYILDTVLELPWGNVLFFEGEQYHVATDGLVIPNGILLSDDKKTLYVANSRNLNIYTIEGNKALTLVQEFPTYTILDNFSLDRTTNNLVVGTHPIGHQIADHLFNPDKHKSTSLVLSVQMLNSSYAKGMMSLYADDGTQISGCSVASPFNKSILIGSVIDSLVFCEINT